MQWWTDARQWRCGARARDVVAAIDFSRSNDLEIGIRCGGHSVPGIAVPDGGLMIDLSPLRAVRVDPDGAGRWCRAAPCSGRWTGRPAVRAGRDRRQRVAHRRRRAHPRRRDGLAGPADRPGVRQRRVVRGRHRGRRDIRASESEHPDLYWALRGGGGNFGVVTEFEFRLHDIGTAALLVELTFDLDQAVSRAARLA